MASETRPVPGRIGWVDLTVPNAGALLDFYSDVTGWSPAPVSMGYYSDYCMNAADGKSVAGVCHARGDNATLPAGWMVDIVMADLAAAVERCQARGGEVLSAPRSIGDSRLCVIQDPAGVIAALYESRSQSE